MELKGYDFAICVTHDIDRTGDNRMFRLVKNSVKGIRNRNFELFKNAFSDTNIDFKISEILDMEKDYGVEQSTWYFLTMTKKLLGVTLPKQGDYELDDKFCQETLKLLKGQEIGLHIPFIELNCENIRKEKQKLDRFLNITGARAHYLKGKYPDLLVELDKAGFLYDTTFGLNNEFPIEFTPFHPTVDGKELKIFEVPLNIMDVNITNYDTFKKGIEKIIPVLKKNHGVLVINWHPNRFNEIEFGDLYRRCFNFLLLEGKINNAWMTSIQNILDGIK